MEKNKLNTKKIKKIDVSLVKQQKKNVGKQIANIICVKEALVEIK